MSWKLLQTTLSDANLDFIAGHPFIYHCHHFNLFLEQTVDDVFGIEQGNLMRVRAARSSSYHFLSHLFKQLDLTLPAERLSLAQEMFSTLGHGRLHINADETGGSAEGEFLHCAFTWKEKYGAIIKRLHPVDSFAAGYVAGTVQAVFDSDYNFTAIETECYAMNAERCHFELEAELDEEDVELVDEAITKIRVKSPCVGLQEQRIVEITKGLRGFLSGVAGDERGLVEAFGVFVTRHTTNYYNQLSYNTIVYMQATHPGLLPIAEELIRESGHVCVFNTFGGILYSPEWEGMVGKVTGNLEEIVSSCMAIARALGFGSWAIEELTEQRFVLRTGSEYESPFCAINEIAPKQNNAYFVQGAAVAIMQLWKAIDWNNRPELNQELYKQLFKNDASWEVKQSTSLAAGDPYTEIVVTYC